MKALAALVAAALVLAGCSPAPAESTTPSSNPAVTVDRLLEHDGCVVYRFYDAGYARYFVRCPEGAARTEWDERYPCGKGQVCTRPQQVLPASS